MCVNIIGGFKKLITNNSFGASTHGRAILLLNKLMALKQDLIGCQARIKQHFNMKSDLPPKAKSVFDMDIVATIAIV